MAPFEAQPEGLGQFLSAAALVVVHLEPPNISPPALPRIKTDTSAAVNETSTDPKPTGHFVAASIPHLWEPGSLVNAFAAGALV